MKKKTFAVYAEFVDYGTTTWGGEMFYTQAEVKRIIKKTLEELSVQVKQVKVKSIKSKA